MVRVQHVRATLPRRRNARWLGVLENDVGRPEGDWARRIAMTHLGNGLSNAEHHEDALSVQEAELAMMRRIGAPEESILVAQGNLAITYGALGRPEALGMKQDVYTGYLKLMGEEHETTLMAASNYANLLLDLRRFEEVRSLLRKMIPVTRRARDNLRHAQDEVELRAGATWTKVPLLMITARPWELESVAHSWKRIFGPAHPETPGVQGAKYGAGAGRKSGRREYLEYLAPPARHRRDA